MEDSNTLLNIAESLGTVSVLAGTVYAFAKGLIVPKSTVDLMLAEKDARISYLEEEVRSLKDD